VTSCCYSLLVALYRVSCWRLLFNNKSIHLSVEASVYQIYLSVYLSVYIQRQLSLCVSCSLFSPYKLSDVTERELINRQTQEDDSQMHRPAHRFIVTKLTSTLQ